MGVIAFFEFGQIGNFVLPMSPPPFSHISKKEKQRQEVGEENGSRWGGVGERGGVFGRNRTEGE